MFIYKITNTRNNKVYIGQTESRWYRNKHIQNAWNKYGEASFTFEVIEQFDPEMNQAKGYNKTEGASAETRSLAKVLDKKSAKLKKVYSGVSEHF